MNGTAKRPANTGRPKNFERFHRGQHRPVRHPRFGAQANGISRRRLVYEFCGPESDWKAQEITGWTAYARRHDRPWVVVGRAKTSAGAWELALAWPDAAVDLLVLPDVLGDPNVNTGAAAA